MNSVTLQDTVQLMLSDNYEDKFKAEYYQVYIRYRELRDTVEKWDAGELDKIPVCPRDLLVTQISYMQRYLITLEYRAQQEGIKLDLC